MVGLFLGALVCTGVVWWLARDWWSHPQAVEEGRAVARPAEPSAQGMVGETAPGRHVLLVGEAAVGSGGQPRVAR